MRDRLFCRALVAVVAALGLIGLAPTPAEAALRPGQPRIDFWLTADGSLIQPCFKGVVAGLPDLGDNSQLPPSLANMNLSISGPVTDALLFCRTFASGPIPPIPVGSVPASSYVFAGDISGGESWSIYFGNTLYEGCLINQYNNTPTFFCASYVAQGTARALQVSGGARWYTIAAQKWLNNQALAVACVGSIYTFDGDATDIVHNCT